MLNPKAFGLACGILWAFGVAALTLMAMHFNSGATIVLALGSVYKGLELSVQGAIVGALWGLVDGFIGGWLLAWLYNKLQ